MLDALTVSECKVERGKGKVRREFVNCLLGSNGKPLPPKQSVKFKCQIWPGINEKFSKKCLDASTSLTIT